MGSHSVTCHPTQVNGLRPALGACVRTCTSHRTWQRIVSSGTTWKRRFQSYFHHGNGVPRNVIVCWSFVTLFLCTRSTVPAVCSCTKIRLFWNPKSQFCSREGALPQTQSPVGRMTLPPHPHPHSAPGTGLRSPHPHLLILGPHWLVPKLLF